MTSHPSKNFFRGLLIIVSLAAISTSACERFSHVLKSSASQSRRGPGVIEFWHSMTGDKSQVLSAIVEDYNRDAAASGAMPIKLTFTGTYTDGINKLRLAVMAGRPPHLAQIYEIGTQQLVDSNGVIPLEELIAGDASFGLDQMLPQVLGYYRIKGKLFSLPFATSNPVIFANGSVLSAAGMQAPPADFADLEAACPRLADPATGRTCLTLPLTSWLFEQAVARQGGLLLDEENGRRGVATTAVYDNAEGRYFLDWLSRLTRAGMFANTGRSWDPPVENFMAGRSALLVTSTSDVFVLGQRAKFPVVVGPFPARASAPVSNAPAPRRVLSEIEEAAGVRREVAPVPDAQPPATGGTVLGGNSIWAMKGRSQVEMRQAYAFLKHLASAPVQRRWHVNTGYFPIRRDVIDALEAEGFYGQNPNARVAVDQLLAAPESPAARGAITGVFPELREHVENAMEEVLAGKATSQEALGRAAEKSTRALQRYRKLL